MRALITIMTNTRCSLTRVREEYAKVIDEALSMEIPGSHFGGHQWGDGKRHLFSMARGTFPKGLLSRVKTLLDELKVKYEVDDQRKHKPSVVPRSAITADMLKGVTLRPYQVRAVKRAIKRHGGILWLATNAGKTECAAAIIKARIHDRALFLVHKKVLLSQARERIAKRLGVIEEHIGIIGEGRFEPQHITVATIQSLTRRAPPAKKRVMAAYLKTVRQLHIDEGHHTKATTWYRLIQRIDAGARFLYSGTPFGDGNGLLVEACVGPVVARVSNAKLIKLGVSAKPTIRIVEVNEPKIPANASWQEVYKAGVVRNEVRNALIAEHAAAFAKDKKPVLILVRELWHGDNIVSALKAEGVSVLFSHGQMPPTMIHSNKVAFEQRRASVLVASTIYDEGVDVPTIEALIVADGGKSIRSVLQKIGRGLRKKTTGANTLDVIDFADTTHHFLANHSQERLAIYEGEGFEVVVESTHTKKRK